MPGRRSNKKALIDYAEQNGLVYVWAFSIREQVVSPAFTKRQQLLSPDQYEIVDVRTLRGVRRAMLFLRRRSCKRSSRPTRRCARRWRSSESSCARSGLPSKRRHHKKRGGLQEPPRRRRYHVVNV